MDNTPRSDCHRSSIGYYQGRRATVADDGFNTVGNGRQDDKLQTLDAVIARRLSRCAKQVGEYLLQREGIARASGLMVIPRAPDL
ncbi:hypothetical protein [Gilvimarinus japonicus]|uniref:Uncharacterized protein n=1 Tax=Gilvimarinus japonicus TaxID=1796469 RepID=A0ABV7HY71_9GAMM